MAPSDEAEDQPDNPFQDAPEIETITASQGFIPDALFFWRRKKPASA